MITSYSKRLKKRRNWMNRPLKRKR